MEPVEYEIPVSAWLAEHMELTTKIIEGMMPTSEDVKDVPSSEEEPHGRPGT